MSVLFNVRRVDGVLLAALRREPSLTDLLCSSVFDFDLRALIAEATAGLSPEAAAQRAATIRQRASIRKTLVEQAEAHGTLVKAGVPRESFGAVLRLERSWWGMEAMIANDVGARIVDQNAGESIGDDVGYGPAQLFHAPELGAIAEVLMGLTRDVVRPRFIAFEAADRAEKTAHGFDVGPPCSEEGFDRWSWEPLCRLRVFVAETARAGDALLRWYD